MREISLVLGAALAGILVVAAVVLGPAVAGANLDRPGVAPVVRVIDPPAAVPQEVRTPDAKALTDSGPALPPTAGVRADRSSPRAAALPSTGRDQHPRRDGSTPRQP
jgi:hypothetical protein